MRLRSPCWGKKKPRVPYSPTPKIFPKFSRFLGIFFGVFWVFGLISHSFAYNIYIYIHTLLLYRSLSMKTLGCRWKNIFKLNLLLPTHHLHLFQEPAAAGSGSLAKFSGPDGALPIPEGFRCGGVKVERWCIQMFQGGKPNTKNTMFERSIPTMFSGFVNSIFLLVWSTFEMGSA